MNSPTGPADDLKSFLRPTQPLKLVPEAQDPNLFFDGRALVGTGRARDVLIWADASYLTVSI